MKFHDLLLDIPRLVALTILKEYGHWKWFCQLDDAYCNSLRRTEFLELLTCEENVFDTLPNIPRPQFKRFIEWLVDRGVKITKLLVITAFRQVKNDKRDWFFYGTGFYLKQLTFEWTIGSIDPILALTAKYCPHLQKLAIFFCALSKSFREILCTAWHLRALRLHECYTIKASQFENLHLTNMRSINTMDSVDGDAVKAMCAACPNLSRLQMAYNKELTNATTVPIRTHCRQLVALNLTHCRALTDAALITILTFCTKITELDISGCEKLTDLTIRAFTKNCTNATKLLMQQNFMYSDKSMEMVSAAFGESLRVLFISDCANISTDGLGYIVASCTKLTSLDIGINAQFQSLFLLAALPVTCGRLVELVLSELAVSDLVLISITQQCRNLTLLHMYGTTGYSLAAVKHLIHCCEHLKELLVSVDDTVLTTVVLQEVRAEVRAGLKIITENYILGHGVLDGADEA